MSEAMKAWLKVPTDQEWHNAMGHDETRPDPKCPICREKMAPAKEKDTQ